jgi:hypothetical protein
MIRIFRRTSRTPTETASQATEAPANAVTTFLSTRIENTNAKASMPNAPSAAPAASRAAASVLAVRQKTRLPFAANFVLLDQGSAGAEDRRQREEETADGGAITAANESGKDRRDAAEREVDQIRTGGRPECGR